MVSSWSYLKPGDIVDIIAPASHSPSEKLFSGLDWIENAGLVPRVPKDLIKRDLFFAAPLELQLEHLKRALYSDSKAIWCLRGGYGSMRLIPYLKKLSPPKRPKLFVGFSDITSLHLFFTQQWNWPVIHGRTISQLDPDLANSSDRRFLKEIVFGKKTDKVFKNLIPLNDAAREERSLHSTMTGGNLRILQSSLGTDWQLKAKNKILFLEDVGERGYSIDRMLEQLIQAKIIDRNLKAIIFGDFTQALEKDGKDFSKKALERFAKRVSYPVLRGLPAGHGKIKNYPLPFNTPCSLFLGRRGSLHCTYGGDL